MIKGTLSCLEISLLTMTSTKALLTAMFLLPFKCSNVQMFKCSNVQMFLLPFNIHIRIYLLPIHLGPCVSRYCWEKIYKILPCTHAVHRARVVSLCLSHWDPNTIPFISFDTIRLIFIKGQSKYQLLHCIMTLSPDLGIGCTPV